MNLTDTELQHLWRSFEIATAESPIETLSPSGNQLSSPILKRRNHNSCDKTEAKREWLTRWKEDNPDKQPMYHTCTRECIEFGMTAEISKEHNIYGCIESGSIHECHLDEHCRSTELNLDSLVVCLISGRVIGSYIEPKKYGKTDTGKQLSDEGTKDADEPDDYSISNNGNEDDEEDIGNDDFMGSFSNSKLESFQIDGSNIDIKEEAGSDSENDGKSTPYSSVPSSPFMANNNNKKRKRRSNASRTKQRKCFNQNSTEELGREAEFIIYDLLFNINARRRINVDKENVLKSKAADVVTRYYKDCKKKKICPSLIELDAIYDKHKNTKELLDLLEYDINRVAKYKKLAIAIWNIIMRTDYFKKNKSGFHFKDHVIGILEILKRGYSFVYKGKSYRIIHRDPYLSKNFPAQEDLKSLMISYQQQPSPTITTATAKTYQKTNTTTGTNNIKNSFLNILRMSDEDVKANSLTPSDIIKELSNDASIYI
jgi:hypothetical protein